MTGESRPRVVSLVPSITETLLAWGVNPVAVTRFCEAPGITTVGGTKNPDLSAIRSLAPDAVLMDEEENRREDAEALAAAGVRVVATAVRSLDGVAGALARIAAAAGLGSPPPAAPGDPTGSGAALRRTPVYVPIWRRPWMTIGGATYGSSILAAAGLDNVFSASTDPYPSVGPGEVRSLRPHFVLAPSEPYPFKERHRAELEGGAGAPVVFVDGQDLFWWGARTPAALGRLRRLAAGLVRG